MQKRDEAFRSIGEVAGLIGVAPHVLRYWETQFPQLRPMKRPDGRRYYRPEDVRLAAGLCLLLRDDGLTIRGARKLIAADKGEAVRARGAARLAEARPLEAPPAPAPSAPAPAPPAPAAALLPADPFPADPDEDAMPLPSDDPGPAAAPHSRMRRRRRAADHGQMPLFDRPLPQGADWLARLAGMARLLRLQDPATPRWSGAAPAALRLGQAIARLY